MKDGTKYGSKFKRLCTKLSQKTDKQNIDSLTDPTTEIVMGCLSEHTTESRAKTAINKLTNSLVGYNELRVCRKEEIVDIIGKSFPRGLETAVQIANILGAIYREYDDVYMTDLETLGKREAKAFLESLDGITPYIVARVMLLSLGAHAFPVHEQMLNALRKEEVVHPKANIADVQSFLERHIPANKARDTYNILRYHVDHFKEPIIATSTKKTKKKTKKTAKKTTKKKTATKSAPAKKDS